MIKFESLDGDSFRRWAATGTRPMQGKRSIAIDLKHAEGQKIAHRFIERANLLMHNFRPGATDRLGIDYETCRKLNPRLVYFYAGLLRLHRAHVAPPGHAPHPGRHRGRRAVPGGRPACLQPRISR